MSTQSAEFKKQSELMDKQNFETTLFNMLYSFEETKRNFDGSMNNVMNTLIEEVLKKTEGVTDADLDTFMDNFTRHFDIPSYQNSQYVFKQFCLILNFINSAKVENKAVYFDITRSKLYARDIKILFHFYHFYPATYYAPIKDLNVFDDTFINEYFFLPILS